MTHLPLAKRLQHFDEYVFVHLNQSIQQVEQESGQKVLNLTMGSPDFPPSPHYIDKLTEYLHHPDAHLYPGYGATPEFSAALIGWYETRFQVTLEKSELLPLLGAKDGVAHLPLALLDDSDIALVPNPGYQGFAGPIKMLGALPQPYDLTAADNFTINWQRVEKLAQKAKFIWVNFPANPTGQVATLPELEQAVSFAKKHNLWLIYDNAYSEITFGGFVAPSILQIKGAKDIAVEIGSFSKTFSFAGLRMGWIVGNPLLVAALKKIKSQLDSGMSLPLQRLGAFALSHPDKAWHQSLITTYAKRQQKVAELLRTLGLTLTLPKGSLYLWAKIPHARNTSSQFCLKLLQQKRVALTPGSAFGSNGEGYVRASISMFNL